MPDGSFKMNLRQNEARVFESKFTIYGTDGCESCETGRVSIFIANKKCIHCDPASYERKVLPGITDTDRLNWIIENQAMIKIWLQPDTNEKRFIVQIKSDAVKDVIRHRTARQAIDFAMKASENG
jgi:hypothetical protein